MESILYNTPYPTFEERGRLPSGYTEVEYIESTGTQYITLPHIYDTANYKLELDVSDCVSSDTRPFGTSAGAYRIGLWNGGEFVSGSTSNYVALTGERKSIIFDGATATVNWTTNTLSYRQVTGDYIPTLFACANTADASAVGYYASIKVYSCAVTSSGAKICDLVPCINPQNVVGMYDLVSQAFFGNAGTGNFIAGEPV